MVRSRMISDKNSSLKRHNPSLNALKFTFNTNFVVSDSKNPNNFKLNYREKISNYGTDSELFMRKITKKFVFQIK